jgi:hypothetical protein
MLICKAKCIKNVGIYSFPHFIIIRVVVLHHTCIGLYKYCDLQKITMKFPQRSPLVAFCDILSRYLSLVEAWPLWKSFKILDSILIVYNTWLVVFG